MLEDETEDIGRAEADHPIADGGDDQRHGGIAQPAQGMGGDGLQAVKDLKHGGNDKEPCYQGGDLNITGISRIEEKPGNDLGL